MKTVWILSAAFAALTACGPLHVASPIENLVTGLASAAVASDDSVAAGSQQEPTLTRALIEEQNVDLLRLSLISREATEVLVFGAQNGTKTTWFGGGSLSFVFDRGVVVGTRGLGDDLMGSDVDAAIAAMRSGGNYARTLDFLTGLDQIERRSYSCTSRATRSETITIVERTYRTTVIEERCTGQTGTFENTYWRGSDGTIWQSRQWVSDGVGYLGYQRL